MADEYGYLLPQPDAETQPWWDAVKAHQLTVQRCTGCGAHRWPPQLTCPSCHGETSEWVRLSGRGTLYSYIVVHQPVLSQWRESVPYNVAHVALEEHPDLVMVGNVVEMHSSDLKVGMALEVVFDDVTPDITIPRWRPLA